MGGQGRDVDKILMHSASLENVKFVVMGLCCCCCYCWLFHQEDVVRLMLRLFGFVFVFAVLLCSLDSSGDIVLCTTATSRLCLGALCRRIVVLGIVLSLLVGVMSGGLAGGLGVVLVCTWVVRAWDEEEDCNKERDVCDDQEG